MKSCLEQIHGYESLYREIEDLRTTAYASTDEQHEKMLLKVSYNILITCHPIKIAKSLLPHSGGITPKHVTSGEAIPAA